MSSVPVPQQVEEVTHDMLENEWTVHWLDTEHTEDITVRNGAYDLYGNTNSFKDQPQCRYQFQSSSGAVVSFWVNNVERYHDGSLKAVNWASDHLEQKMKIVRWERSFNPKWF